MARSASVTRRDPDGVVSPLPSLETLTSDDAAYLAAMLGLAESGSMFKGRYVEAHLARVLGAQLPTTGINLWDLFLPGPRDLKIEVKATTPRGSFKVKAIDKDVDLWIFVTYEHDAKTRRPRGFRYAVGTPSEIEPILRDRKTVGATELMDQLKVLSSARALKAAVGRHCSSAKG